MSKKSRKKSPRSAGGRGRYTPEIRRDALLQAGKEGVADAAEMLGIIPDLLFTWQSKIIQSALVGLDRENEVELDSFHRSVFVRKWEKSFESYVKDGGKFSDSTSLEIDSILRAIEDFDELEIKKGNLVISVVGGFNAGKSTFINALLGERDLCPMAATEKTRTTTRIIYSKNRFFAEEKDGTKKKVQENEYRESVCTKGNNSTYEIGLPNPILKMGVELIDTPGSNGRGAEEQAAVSSEVLDRTDVLLVLMDVNKGDVTADLLGFLENINSKYPFVICAMILTRCDKKNLTKKDGTSGISGIFRNLNDKLSAHLSGGIFLASCQNQVMKKAGNYYLEPAFFAEICARWIADVKDRRRNDLLIRKNRLLYEMDSCKRVLQGEICALENIAKRHKESVFGRVRRSAEMSADKLIDELSSISRNRVRYFKSRNDSRTKKNSWWFDETINFSRLQYSLDEIDSVGITATGAAFGHWKNLVGQSGITVRVSDEISKAFYFNCVRHGVHASILSARNECGLSGEFSDRDEIDEIVSSSKFGISITRNIAKLKEEWSSAFLSRFDQNAPVICPESGAAVILTEFIGAVDIATKKIERRWGL